MEFEEKMLWDLQTFKNAEMGLVAVLLSPRAMVYKLQLSIYDTYICKKENDKAVNASGM